MDEPSTNVSSATCMLNQAMTGIHVAKPIRFRVTARASPDGSIRTRDHIEPGAIGASTPPERYTRARGSVVYESTL